MLCLVCGAPEAEPHFGAISCRACAAFFRRYFHSKKGNVSCTCSTRYSNSHPCRECRIQKCLSIGMDEKKVQSKREKHPNKRKKAVLEVTEIEELEVEKHSSTSSESCSSLAVSPVNYHIVPRDTSNIFHTVSKWTDLQPMRRHLYNKRIDELTYYETCCATKTDCMMIWKLVEQVIPDVRWLSFNDKNAVLRNFNPRWALLVSAIDFLENRSLYLGVLTIENYYDMIVKFYMKSIPAEHKISREEILRVFEPFLRFYGLNLAIPICERQFDSVEYMCITLLLLFDGAFTNISVECSEMCHNIRKVIMRQLRAYHTEKNCDEMRFIETVDTLAMMEKGEAKFQEELLVCEMYNVHIHEDYRLMMKEHRI